MPDREKTTLGIREMIMRDTWRDIDTDRPRFQRVLNDAITMLKEQEAIKPKSKVRHGANAQIQHFCGRCNAMLHGKPKFCSECGQGVKWK